MPSSVEVNIKDTRTALIKYYFCVYLLTFSKFSMWLSLFYYGLINNCYNCVMFSQIDDISRFQLILVKYLCYLNLIFLAVCLLSSTKYVIYIIGILRILFFRFFTNWKKLKTFMWKIKYSKITWHLGRSFICCAKIMAKIYYYCKNTHHRSFVRSWVPLVLLYLVMI